MKFDTRKILRNRIHDIIMELPSNDYLRLTTVCKVLKSDYRINITPEALHLILSRWVNKKVTNVFIPYDKRWLDYDIKKKHLKNAIQDRDEVLGKSRSRILEEEKRKKLEKEKKSKDVNQAKFKNLVVVDNKRNMASIFAITAKVIKSTFVDITEQQIEEIRDKIIRNTEIPNTYESYWNTMTILGENMGLKYQKDYMKYSPESFEKELN